LNKYPKPEIFEELIVSILDLPGSKIKADLLNVFTQVKKHVMIFAMNLTQLYTKLFAFLSENKTQFTGSDLELFVAMCKLASVVCRSSQKARKELTTSLVLPIVSFASKSVNLYSQDDQAYMLESQIVDLFIENLLSEEII